MESLASKEVIEQIRTEKETAKDDSKEARAAKLAAQTSPLRKVVNLAELGAIGYLLYYFRKPLKTIGHKVFEEIDKEVIKITEAIKIKIMTDELALRKAIVNNYLLDPIQAYRLGPSLYNELITNAGWHLNIYTTYDAIPASVSPTFTIGTGSGAITVSSTLVKGLSVQILALCEYLIASGQPLDGSTD